jgi:uncharacterized protein
MSLVVEWDPDKARTNRRKHGISFEEAATIFADPLSLTIPDPGHSIGEMRFLDLGLSRSGRLPAISYAERGGRIRLITARLASRRERVGYEAAGD